MGTVSYITRRILATFVTFLAASLIVFFMIHLIPGNPIEILVNPRTPKQVKQKLREKYGLDKPVAYQYFRFLKNFFTGDLGSSIYTGSKITNMILERLPNTVRLTAAALVISFIIGIPLGIIASLYQGSILDFVSMGISLIGLAMPQFWLGLLLILTFCLSLNWFPISAVGTLKGLVLPAITLGAYGTGLTARITRSSMLEVINEDYITTARSKGISERIVYYKHALSNALIPVISLFGLRLGWLVGGAVMVETVFNRPGIGRLIVQSLYRRDYLVVQLSLLMLVVAVTLGNLLADILSSLIDPRIRFK